MPEPSNPAPRQPNKDHQLTHAKYYRVARRRYPACILREPGDDNRVARLIRLSERGRELQAYVQQPISQRQRCNYDAQLLDGYEPNVTAYLSDSLRAQLHLMARAPTLETSNGMVAGTFARNILDRLLIDLSWSSSRLEGNSYSWLETERLIRSGQLADHKTPLDAQMVLNHKAAIEYLVYQIDEIDITPSSIKSLHALLSDGLLADASACGRLRWRAVDIGHCAYAPLSIPQLLEERFERTLLTAARIEDPFEQCFFLLAHLPYLQPFEDVNKRVSRLAANIALIKHNVCPLSFIDVPQRTYLEGLLAFYETGEVDLLRDVFVWAYERSCQQYVAIRKGLVPPNPLRLRYRFVLKDVVRHIIGQQLAASDQTIRDRAASSVKPEDMEAFVQMTLNEFQHLHPDNLIRYGLHPLQWQTWCGQ